ncbi:hypothetical protein [Methylobacillus flagellatus]|uniref:hypothetical protein n=1 Tax=Methylobacillus flagellatus TaxID=405 RepID=UPI001485AAF4|nr:hypothetical protein [Methylobacillus flagellatus]
MTMRQYGLLVVLLLSVAATVWTAVAEDELAELAVPGAPEVRPPRTTAASAVKNVATNPAYSPAAQIAAAQNVVTQPDTFSLAMRTPQDEEPGELFGHQSAQQAAQALAAPPKPTVPPLPFIYAGKLEDDGDVIVFLSEGDRHHAVHAGDVLGDWKVLIIAPPRMTLRFLPLNREVSMTIGEVN